jgi:hypothetical protein
VRLVAAAILGCIAFASPTLAQTGLFWVVGSNANGCWIVQQNPVIDGSNIQFSDGPYRSEDDAKLAMTTISVCKT